MRNCLASRHIRQVWELQRIPIPGKIRGSMPEQLAGVGMQVGRNCSSTHIYDWALDVLVAGVTSGSEAASRLIVAWSEGRITRPG